jgi:hypothetical protein
MRCRPFPPRFNIPWAAVLYCRYPPLRAPGSLLLARFRSETRYDRPRSLEIERQGVGRETPEIASLSPLSTGLFHCLVFLKLFERIYSPLAAGLLQPYRADSELRQHKRTQLDRLYRAGRGTGSHTRAEDHSTMPQAGTADIHRSRFAHRSANRKFQRNPRPHPGASAIYTSGTTWNHGRLRFFTIL